MSEQISPMPGWLYRTDRWKHDQSYGWCVPVSTKNGWFMQDTYQLDIPSIRPDEADKHEAAIRRAMELSDGEDHSYVIRYCSSNYYHTASCLYNTNDFEPVCFLGDYRYATENDAKRYLPEDVINNVQLYREHGYSFTYGDIGVYLVFTGAVPSELMTFRRDLEKFTYNRTLPVPCFFSEPELPKDATLADLMAYDYAIQMNKLLHRQRLEVDKLIDDYRLRLGKVVDE